MVIRRTKEIIRHPTILRTISMGMTGPAEAIWTGTSSKSHKGCHKKVIEATASKRDMPANIIDNIDKTLIVLLTKNTSHYLL